MFLDHETNHEYRADLSEPAEVQLFDELMSRRPVIETAAMSGVGYREALVQAAGLAEPVDKFFKDVMVMAEQPKTRRARLRLLYELELTILKLADISEIVSEEK